MMTDAERAAEAAAIAREYGGATAIPAEALPHPDPARLVEQIYQRERATRHARRRLDAEERGPIACPPLVALPDLLAEPEPPIAWRVEGWQPAESRVILTATAKAGKTTLRDTLVRALADGEPWLGTIRVSPIAGTIAILDTEMSRRQLRAWLRDQWIRRADRVRVVALRGQCAALDLLDADTRAHWATALRAASVRYLVLDCLRPVLDALGLDEHRDAGRYLVALDALLREANIQDALVIHHMGHGAERARGDSRLRDWPDVEWRLMRQDDDPASPRYLGAYGRDVDVPETQLAYDAAARRLTVAGGTRREAGARAALDAVLETLDGTEAPLSGRRVWAALEDSDHPRAAVYAALRLGVRTGALVVEDGPRRSRLYRRAAAQCASVPDCAEHTGTHVSVSVPPPIYRRDTRTHSTDGRATEDAGTLSLGLADEEDPAYGV